MMRGLSTLPCQALALLVSSSSSSRRGAASAFVATPRFFTSSSPLSSSVSSSRLYQAATSMEYGLGMDQQAMMESDLLVIVDEKDDLVDTDMVISKKLAHTFSVDQPRGICHRAFSLFIFNPQGELLLTQRAASKITFPSVWTNTCCSHPLQGMTPNEVDIPSVAYPHFEGIKHAAIRKVKHELGITSMKHADIQFISRFHYWASDTPTHGSLAPWGEHEVDYILFCQMPEPTLSPDPDEVANVQYVSIPELKAMMASGQHTWSPWFLGIMERGGFAWWADLENSLRGKNTNPDVTFFDPDPAFVADYNLPTHTRQTGVLSSNPR